MRILKIIHGYPPRYNAGSEVYSRTLCAGLSRRHEVHVFTREENPFVADGVVREEHDLLSPEVKLHIVNAAQVGINYQSRRINRAFAQVAGDVKPDVAHIGHLNHLSLGIVDELATLDIPIVFTLHDFWLMCLRGQFIQIAPSERGEIFPPCDGQDNQKCADRCLRRFGGGEPADTNDWRQWVAGRMTAVYRMVELVDIFIAPAKSLAERFCTQFPLPPEKIKHLDYGFDRKRLSDRRRVADGKFIFGYIGTHTPGKGVHHLLEAFGQVAAKRENCELHIWGRLTDNTKYLKSNVADIPTVVRDRIKWRGEYANTISYAMYLIT